MEDHMIWVKRALKFREYMLQRVNTLVWEALRSHIATGDDAVKDVHTGHCCALHGCKYGNDQCPVELGTKIQQYPCEVCSDDFGPRREDYDETETE